MVGSGWLDPRGFCRQSRLVIVAGKGGVGKTTVTATLARLASRVGLSVLVVEVEGRSALSSVFGAEPLDYEEQVLAPAANGAGEIRARTLTPDIALLEYLEEHSLRRLSRRLLRTGALEVVATAAPGSARSSSWSGPRWPTSSSSTLPPPATRCGSS
jgi:arsenite-transporting ATPase